jgi:hypothetical protein
VRNRVSIEGKTERERMHFPVFSGLTLALALFL